jgi:hypothetical protein
LVALALAPGVLKLVYCQKSCPRRDWQVERRLEMVSFDGWINFPSLRKQIVLVVPA